MRTAEIAAYLLPDSMGTGGFTECNIKFRVHTLLGGDGEVDPVPESGALERL